VRQLKDAITSGAPEGVVGNVNCSTIRTAALTAALERANQLRCRSDDAAWLFEVAEALLELREGETSAH
jgi:hypothetical protein